MNEIKKAAAILVVLTLAVCVVQPDFAFAELRRGNLLAALFGTEETTAEEENEETTAEQEETEETTLKPEKRYTVTLKAGNTAGTEYTLSTLKGENIKIPGYVPFRPGYKFTGWTDKEGSAEVILKAGDEITPDKDLIFYGVWTHAEFSRCDLNSSGFVDAADARSALRISVDIDKSDEEALKLADIDGDGQITSSDARFILRYSVGNITGNRDFEKNESAIFKEVTDKNYVVYEIDGITYIEGIVIANKTYPLPKNYNPGGLKKDCEAAFLKMANDLYAQKGLYLWVGSGFRSFETQDRIYNRYCDRDGQAAADTYSARPGHSEHQTGYAIDLNTITQSFAFTPEGKWVKENCHKYGFILRYPKNKTYLTGYCYEPWHIRYVGTEISEKIYASGLCVEEYYGINSVYGR